MNRTNYPHWCEMSFRSVLYRNSMVESCHIRVRFSGVILSMWKVCVDGLCKMFVGSSVTQGTSTTTNPLPHTKGLIEFWRTWSQGCGVTLNFGTWEKTEINNLRRIVGNTVYTLILRFILRWVFLKPSVVNETNHFWFPIIR